MAKIGKSEKEDGMPKWLAFLGIIVAVNGGVTLWWLSNMSAPTIWRFVVLILAVSAFVVWLGMVAVAREETRMRHKDSRITVKGGA